METLLVIILLFKSSIRTIAAITTQGSTIQTTTADPCFVLYGCLNGASCPNAKCQCIVGFKGQRCENSELSDLEKMVLREAAKSDIANATMFVAEAHTMMDNHLSFSFTGMKHSIDSANSIAEEIVKSIGEGDELANNAIVDLSALTKGITDVTTDVLEGIKQANAFMKKDELENAVLLAESNLLGMMNLMLNKRDNRTKTSAEIDTAEISARFVKCIGGRLPFDYSGSNGGLSLPYAETFQDTNRKENVSISVITYKESPYLHVENPDDVGSSVIKLSVLDRNGNQITDIKDLDDPVDVFVYSNQRSGDEFFNDMTESFADSGVFMSYVDTNETAGCFSLEIKLASMKICDTFVKYYSFPTEDSYDMYVQTMGMRKIIYKDPLGLSLSFRDQILKISVAPDIMTGTLKPVVVTTSCQDDRYDTARRKKRGSGLSLVKHQFRTSLLNAWALNDTNKRWTSNSSITDIRELNGRIQFKSQFFGTFSANMFFIGPSTIDFSKLFVKFTTSVADSPYALSAIVAVIVLFALLTVPLCRFDKSDEIMWSYLSLVDNPTAVDVVYYIAVETSVTSSKVMASTVFINLIGKAKSSGTRKLDDGIRQNFKRGTSSHFEMRMAEDLGDLTTLQIWHDNKDGRTAWNLQKVSIIKAETNERYTFLCGKWLSLDSSDGKTWRSIQVLDASSIETDTLFFNLSQRKIFDDHLWVSLFKRPTFSRFTRVQRLWCLVALLFLSMIASAMWYDTSTNNKMQTISVGPIKLNYKQFYVGFLSAMIALVPSLILVMIFRNRKFKGEQYYGCCVPWWFIFVAYGLIFICVGTSATFVFLYSLEWGGKKSLEWMVSFFLSIFQSVIFLEPVKAIILAILISCLFKKMGSKELSDTFLPVPSVVKYTENEDLKKLEEGNITLTEYPVYPEFPGTEEKTAEMVVARQRAQIDKRLWCKFQSWLSLVLYVVLVAVICSHSKVSTAKLQNDHIINTLKTVSEPSTTKAIYDYLKTTFIPAVYPKWWESEDDKLLRSAYEQRFLYNAYNFRLTHTRFRQVRVMGPCVTRESVDRCVPSFNEDAEEKRNFCRSWREFNETDCFDENEEYQYSFLYSTASQSAGDLTYVGEHGTYGPGGYYVDLGPLQSLFIRYLDLLEADNWIDYRTRALFLDVVTYNANTRLFSHIKVVFEIPTTGSVTMTTVVWSANLYPYVYPLDYVVLLLQIIFIIVWCVRFVLFIIMRCKKCKKSLRSVSTYLRLLEQTFGATAFVCYILRIDATISAIEVLRRSIGKYASFELVRVYDAAYQGCLAAVLFIVMLDLLKPLEFNYHFFTLISSLKIAMGAITAFMLIITIEIIAFSSLLYLTIGRRHVLFKSMMESMNTILRVLLGMITYSSQEFDDLLLKFYFGLFTLTMTITLVNVFIALLTFSFNDVKAGLENGSLQFDQKLHDHFWFKVDKVIEWIRDKFCFTLTRWKKNELERLQESLERLKRIANVMSTNDLDRHKMVAKLMIKMIQMDKHKIKLDCLDVQGATVVTKYIFGFSDTGETHVILTVPILSCDVEINLSCYLVPCLRLHCIRKIKNTNVGKTFMFFTNDTHLLKGSIVLEVLDKQYNSMVAKSALESPWEQCCAHKTTSGVRAEFPQIPMYFAAMLRDIGNVGSSAEWRPLETYQISVKGGTAFPSYDPNVRVSFPENAFEKECKVSLRTRPGEVASVLSVVLEFPSNLSLSVNLPEIFSEDGEPKTDNLAELIIVVREGPNDEWEKLNSVLTKEEDGFHFSFNKSKACSNFEVTVKNSTVFWVTEFGVNTLYDIDLIKAIVMVSNNRDVANEWRKLARLLNIAPEEIEIVNDSPLCKEEKCCMVFRKWLETSEVSFKMLTDLLTTMGFRMTAEHIRKKWMIKHPGRQLSKFKSTLFPITPSGNFSTTENTSLLLSRKSMDK